MKVLILTICLIMTVSIVYASSVEIALVETLQSKLNTLIIERSSNMVRITPVFYNTGSIGYKKRARLDVYDGEDLIFVSWSKEQELLPGDIKYFDMYWYADSGNYSLKLTSFFDGQTQEHKTFGVYVKDLQSEDVFEIRNFRTYEEYVIFDVYSREHTTNVITVPSNYPDDWIFEYVKIETIGKGQSKTVLINYQGDLDNNSVSILIGTMNGKYFSEEVLEMKRYGTLLEVLYYALDHLKLLFS